MLILLCVSSIMKRSYTFSERQHILSFVVEAKANPNLRGQTISQLLRLASTPRPPPSRDTYYAWLRNRLTQEEYHAKLSRRGRPPLLTEEQKMLLIGYSCHRRRLLKTVSLRHLQDFSSTHFNVILSDYVVSIILKERGFSSQRALKRSPHMTTQKVIDDSIQFLEELRSYNYPPSCILIMDETGLWSNTVKRITYHYRGGFVSLTSSSFFIYLSLKNFFVSLRYFLSRSASS